MATVSIIGLYNIDDTIFNNMVYPNGFTSANQQTTIDEILFECAELEILYPDPEVMQTAIQRWSEAELPSWQRMYDALMETYNPLWNVDATVTETLNRTSSGSGTNEEDGTKNNVIDRDVNDTLSGSGTDTLHTVPFNASAVYTARDKQTNENDSQDIITEDITNDDTTHNEGAWTDSREDEESRSVRRTGNIGVTASQQLIEMEIGLAKYNIIRTIVDSFKQRFCILVY